MLDKIKDIILKTDNFLYKKFGSDRSLKFLNNIKETEIIFSILNTADEEIKTRFVGGCIRKSLSGEDVDDIDLATSFTPEEVKKKFNDKGIKVIETGISHGTVTAILNKKKFEITTLRKDVSTDGRHADVEFTNNWELDASRRDFTINAIYADIYGRIFDPYNGVSDLKIGKIKFIGSPEERIQEDYLRILRYVRFHTQYSRINHEQNIIHPIKKYINGLNIISNERIFSELQKILKLKNIYSLFLDDFIKEIILNIFPTFKYYERLKTITVLDQKLKNKYDFQMILALLIVDQSNNYEYFCHRYKTSNKLKNRLRNLSVNFENLKSKKFFSEENMKKLIYLNGKDSVKDLLLFSLCVNSKIKSSHFEKILAYVSKCDVPKFPISGDYLKSKGYKTGENLGKKLKLLEAEWIKNNFVIEKKIIEKSLGQINNED